ncbi:pantetheine-phosphate adenylyltransferase family protein-like protein [Aulographum hederae CBS 113979]|uniref:Pantetheine-phosphate adenylyltransferase family protein-like protein n=1 Tax=Aulographum hederae CBS 113979 TaxID=1176131 RepID=A0A6G1HAL1_9PEZI|nr:pantetheine-phosphate adenylyltransferase family protein-like protein [Aulographum hederae CBS 113979]
MAPLNVSPSLALLLLPPPPSSSSYPALKAAYHATLFTVLRDLSRTASSKNGPLVLEIALPCPHLYGQTDTPRSTLYAKTQSLLANLYKLVCIISANNAIDVEDADGIDPRIMLVAYPRSGDSEPSAEASAAADMQGPVVNIKTLSRCGRAWDTIFSVESEPGEILLKRFLAAGKPYKDVRRIRGGIVQVSANDDMPNPPSSASARKHYSVAVGGTFDHLHIGHKLLLTMTAFMVDQGPVDLSKERSMTIGITGDQLLQNKKFAEYLESWDERQASVWSFYRSVLNFTPADHHAVQIKQISEPGPNGHAVHVVLPSSLVIKCVEIWDPFGPTITDESISALIISGETRSGGKAVNSKRAESGWDELEVFEVDVLETAEDDEGDVSESSKVDESFQNKLSSTEIRRLQSEKGKSRSKV